MKNLARQTTLRLQVILLGLAFGIGVASPAGAQVKFPETKIKNFGQMDERFYRGAQPKADDYQALAALGITTVIDLRDDAKDYAKEAAEAAGLRYINIPMSDTKRPRDEQIDEFMKLATDPATGKFYVHCAGGRHRTGVMGAVYRMRINSWNYDQVYKEMKEYDYYSRWGHGAIKEYVQDYYQRMQTEQIKASSGETSSSSK